MKNLTTARAASISAVLIAASFGVTGYFYPSLPQTIATHWNAAGMPDATAGKDWFVFLPSLIALGLAGLLFLLPRIDPLRKDYSSFIGEYNLLILLVVGFLVLMQGMTLVWNLGLGFDMTRVICPALGLLFIGIGSVLPRLKRNSFAGVRTPWALASDANWDATQAHAGKVFSGAGLLACFGAIIPEYALLLLVAPIVLGTVWIFVHSYLTFRKSR